MSPAPLKSIGLFAGIGGIELGLKQGAGARCTDFSEVNPAAQAVLRHHFAKADVHGDVRGITTLRACDILTAGFPCQDLSQAGRNAGIRGSKSGLVDQVFRLLETSADKPDWLVLENVPFMLRLDRGAAMRYLTRRLSDAGMRWAYRVVDARAFGVPQRRRRVLLVASFEHDPRPVLFGEETASVDVATYEHGSAAVGFYWTEGNTGLGWAPNCIPTIKGGSGLGIPSPPAIWMSDGRIVTPDIRDAERLQGFDPDWTAPALNVDGAKAGARWKMVGNAVCVPMSRWLGKRLASGSAADTWPMEIPLTAECKWPGAAWGESGKAWSVELSEWPIREPVPDLEHFLQFSPHPLSERATRGFFSRLQASSLRRPAEFDEALASHLAAYA